MGLWTTGIVSILYPLYKLTLKLQEDEISLAKALIEALSAWEKMTVPAVKFVDEFGKPTSEKKSLESFNGSFVAFRSGIAASIRTRLLDRVDDETLIGVALDPDVYAALETCVCGTNEEFSDDAKDYVRALLRRVDSSDLAEDICARIVKVYKAKDANDVPVETASSDGDEAETRFDQINGTIDRITPADADARVGDDIDDDDDDDFSTRAKRLRQVAEPHRSDSTNERESALAKAESELERFKIERKKCWNLTSLEFWGPRATSFPCLFHLFVASRGARPASARLESCFSVVGAAVPSQRASLTVDSLNQVILVKNSKITPSEIRRWSAKVV